MSTEDESDCKKAACILVESDKEFASSPIATGGGGKLFEQQVDALSAVQTLLGVRTGTDVP